MASDGPENKFPDMKPMSGAPTMFTLNGIGTRLYGERDFDDETGTYVATLAFVVLFVPVFFLSAYRVASVTADRWHFIGKVPLSGLATGYNLCVGAMIGLACIGFGLNSYTSSPDYLAGERMDEAAELVDAGEVVNASSVYAGVARGGTSHAAQAKTQLKTLATQNLASLPLSAAAAVLHEATDAQVLAASRAADEALTLLEGQAGEVPPGTGALLDVATNASADDKEVSKRRRTLLEGLVADHPGETVFASALAVDYETSGDRDKCRKLLEPVADKLGDGEGARILGQIYAGRGDYAKAYDLLEPYTSVRLAAFREAQSRYDEQIDAARTSIVRGLKRGDAPESFYDDYERSNDAQKQQLVGEYVSEHLQKYPELAKARMELDEYAAVVPVALDMGRILVNRAQSVPDAPARQADLKKAKKTFLSVRAVAANSPQYQLYLGQVYFWLGEHDKGDQQFEKLLKSSGDKPAKMLTVAHALRQVGESARARKLAEDVYAKAKKGDVKNQAAMSRALTTNDLDETITWWERADQTSPAVKAGLAGARARRARREGDTEKAERGLRKKIQIYAQQTPTTDTLNNAALGYFALYEITGDRADFDRGADKMGKALEMSPSNSLVIFNAAAAYRAAGIQDVVGASMDLSVLKRGPSLDMVSYLYNDAKTHDMYVERLRGHPAIKKALGAMQRARLLAPKAAWTYTRVLDLQTAVQDERGMERLAEQTAAVDFDLTDRQRVLGDFWSGKDDEKHLADLASRADELDAILEKLDPRRQRVEFAIAGCERAGIETIRALVGGQADIDRAVSLSERAYKAAASQATRECVEQTRAARAVEALAAKDAEFRARVERTRRAVGYKILFTLAIQDDGLRPMFVADRDAKRVVELIHTQYRALPGETTVWDWRTLRAVEPERAEQKKGLLTADKMVHLRSKILGRVDPLSVRDGVYRAWLAEADGDAKRAASIRRSYTERGAPMPL